MHVLFLPSFYSDPDKPLIGSFFKEQAQALIRSGLTLRVVFVEPRGLRAMRWQTLQQSHWQIARYLEDGVLTIRQHGWNPYAQFIMGGLVWSNLTVRLVKQYIREFGRPQLIHAHNTYWAGHAAYVVWRSLGIPYVITEHSSAYLCDEVGEWQRRIGDPVVRSAASVCAVSDALKSAVELRFPGLPIKILPNCVDTDFFLYSPKSSKTGMFIILAVAHLSENKGFTVLLRAFAKAFQSEPGVVLRIGGHGPFKNVLLDLAGELGISHRVEFLGELSREDVRREICAADIFVVSSFHETFGVVLLEAMATGTPVIATKCGGPEEIVTAECGILVAPGDVSEMALALQIAWKRSFNRTKIRAYVEEYYGQPTFSERLKAIYLSCLA